MEKNTSHDLNDFMDQIYSDLASEYKRLRTRLKADPGTAGDQGEENWQQLLKKWIPSYFKIVTKGRLINEFGYVSPQIDLLILRPEYPEFLISKKLYLTGGVIAVFEIKTTFKLKHLEKFFATCIDIKKNTFRNISVSPTAYSDLQKPLLFGLLAHSHDLKKEKIDNAKKVINAVRTLNKTLISHPSHMPDLICVSDLLTITSQKIVEFEETGGPLVSYITYPQLGSIKMDKDEKIPIAALLTQLFKKVAYQYTNLQHIANYFSLTGIQKGGSGSGRQYGTDVYSEQVKVLLKNRALIPYKEMHEWVRVD